MSWNRCARTRKFILPTGKNPDLHPTRILNPKPTSTSRKLPKSGDGRTGEDPFREACKTAAICSDFYFVKSSISRRFLVGTRSTASPLSSPELWGRGGTRPYHVLVAVLPR